MRVSTLLKILPGIFLSGAAIVWLCYAIEWRQVWTIFIAMPWWPLLPMFLLLVLQMVLRSYRWGFLLPEAKPVSFRVLFDSLMVGALASNILPLRAGEFVRPLLAARQSEHSFSTAFVSVVLERFFDLSAVLVSFGIVVALVPTVPPWVMTAALALSGVAAALLLFLVCAGVAQSMIRRLCDGCCRLLPAVLGRLLRRVIDELLLGAAVLKRFDRMMAVVGLTGLIWASTFGIYYLSEFLFEMQSSLLVAVCTTVFIALAVAAPSAPGFIGIYQVACIAAFALFGLDREIAAAYAIITHLFQYLLCNLYGAFALSRTPWTLRSLAAAQPTQS
jgi:uncharacterized protein (TIRG00374 family)